jgi:hypothetical protein
MLLLKHIIAHASKFTTYTHTLNKPVGCCLLPPYYTQSVTDPEHQVGERKQVEDFLP